MNPEAIRLLIALGISALRSVTLATKNTTDDKIAAGVEAAYNVFAARPDFNAWTAISVLLEFARFYASQTGRTADDKLTAEFQAVVAALEPVVGNAVYRKQLEDITIEWPYLDAPGKPRT